VVLDATEAKVSMDGGGVELEVDPSRKIIRVIVRGAFTEALAGEASRTMRSAPEFQSGFGTLIDLCGVTNVEVTSETVQGFAERAQKDRNRVAILVNQAVLYGLARLYEILSDLTEDRVRVFQDEASAIDWLIAG
jgi:hypothetical protein